MTRRAAGRQSSELTTFGSMNSMTGSARPEFRPLPACLAGSQVSQWGIMAHRAKLSVPVGQANRGGLVFVLSNYKSSARARRAGTGRDEMLLKKHFDRLLLVAHPRSFLPERTYMKSPKHSLLRLLFPCASIGGSTTGLLAQMPRSRDRRASVRLARTARSPLRSLLHANRTHSRSQCLLVIGGFEGEV